VTTILAITIFTVVVLEFFHSTWIQRSLTGGFRDGVQAYYAAKSGINLARLVLQEQGDQRLSYDALNQKWAGGAIPLPIGGETAFVRITDESGKININRLVSNSGYPEKKVREHVIRLFNLLDVDPDLVDAIQDWIDKDDNPMDRGAETNYYQSLSKPYLCKNSRLDSIEELRFVRGITREVYAKISPHLSVFSEPFVNINTADSTILQSLDKRITPNRAGEIIQFRNLQPFERKEEIKRVPGMEEVFPKISLLIGVKSNYFSATSDADFNGTTRLAHALLQRIGTQVEFLYLRIS